MKTILFLSAVLISFVSISQDIEIITSKRVLVFDDEFNGEEAYKMHISYILNLENVDVKSIKWKLSGEEGKNWKIISGSLNEKDVDLEFKKIGTYDIAVDVKYEQKVEDKVQKGTAKDKRKKYITVTSDLRVLRQLYNTANNKEIKKKGKWMKLIKKADVISNKPAYSKDPIPSAYLARGYWGMEKSTEKDERVKDPYKDALKACQKAIKLDLNGIFIDMKDHKKWLDDFQFQISNDDIFEANITYDDQEIPSLPLANSKEEKEEVEKAFANILKGLSTYKKTTKNPFVVSWFSAGVQFFNKGASNAKKELQILIPELEKMRDLNDLTNTDKKFLKHGLMFCAIALKEENPHEACKFLNKANDLLGNENDFRIFYTSVYNACQEKE